MPAYLVIHARPNVHGQKLREFHHRPDIESGLYVWENRALTTGDNAVVRKMVERHAILRPYTRLLPETKDQGPETKDQKPQPDPRDAQIAELQNELSRTKEALSATLTRRAPKPATRKP